MDLSQGAEELLRDTFVKSKFRWELHQHWTELFAKAARGVEKLQECATSIHQSCDVGHSLGDLHREPKVFRGFRCPTLPCRPAMRPVKAGVYLHTP